MICYSIKNIFIYDNLSKNIQQLKVLMPLISAFFISFPSTVILINESCVCLFECNCVFNKFVFAIKQSIIIMVERFKFVIESFEKSAFSEFVKTSGSCLY
jgi:hypothetical protein